MFGDRKKLVMCQACRGLVEASASTCPLCGRESVPRLRIRVSEKTGGESFFSILILAINIGLFVMMAAVDASSGAESFSLMRPSTWVFRDFGGRVPTLIDNGQLWRLVTPNFLHLGLMHLMFNSLSLYYLGPQVEGLFGSQKFIFIYLATGIFSNVASYSFGIHGAGASGSIFGLIGLMLVYGHRLGGSFGGAIRQQMLIWGVAGFIYGFVMGADNVAHAGGFVAGAALAYVIPAEEPTLARSALIWNITAIACALVVVASFGMVAKNYGNAQAESSIMQSFESAARLEDEFRRSATWKTAADGDPQELASRLRTAALSLNRYSDIDSRSQQICARLVDLANKRAAALDAAKTGGAVGEPNIQEIQSAFEEYLAWWHGKRRELGLE